MGRIFEIYGCLKVTLNWSVENVLGDLVHTQIKHE